MTLVFLYLSKIWVFCANMERFTCHSKRWRPRQRGLIGPSHRIFFSNNILQLLTMNVLMETTLAFMRSFVRRLRASFRERRSAEKIFSDIHDGRKWVDPESVSGPGSTLAQTDALRASLPPLLQILKIESLLDAPCGDFNWMKDLDLGIRQYIGGDVVKTLVDKLNDSFARPGRRFQIIDIIEDPLPKVDAILCRDCLVHFSYSRITKTLRNIKLSGSTYLLSTTFNQVKENTDIVTGDWRPINLRLHPFNFPPPLHVILEFCDDSDVVRFGKALAVWRVDDLPS